MESLNYFKIPQCTEDSRLLWSVCVCGTGSQNIHRDGQTLFTWKSTGSWGNWWPNKAPKTRFSRKALIQTLIIDMESLNYFKIPQCTEDSRLLWSVCVVQVHKILTGKDKPFSPGNPRDPGGPGGPTKPLRPGSPGKPETSKIMKSKTQTAQNTSVQQRQPKTAHVPCKVTCYKQHNHNVQFFRHTNCNTKMPAHTWQTRLPLHSFVSRSSFSSQSSWLAWTSWTPKRSSRSSFSRISI